MRYATSIQAVHDRFVGRHGDEIRAHRRAVAELRKRGLPTIAGGVDVPVHPLGPPTVDGSGNITVPMLLQQPTRITRMIMDLTLQRFLLDRIFTNAGSVSGGAVLYDEATENELYLKDGHDIEPIAPGAEYPVVQGEHAIPKIAAVEKWGGKGWITDEARDRNDLAYFTRVIRQMANSIVRKLNTRALEKLDTAISTHSRTESSVSWADALTTTQDNMSASLSPLATFADAMRTSEDDELGIMFNLVILNPQEWAALVTYYGGLDKVRGLLGELGFSFYVTPRQTAGKAKFVGEGQVGSYRVEQPLQTVTYRGSAGEDTDRTFTKSSVRPVMYVDNPFAVKEYTGLAA